MGLDVWSIGRKSVSFSFAIVTAVMAYRRNTTPPIVPKIPQKVKREKTNRGSLPVVAIVIKDVNPVKKNESIVNAPMIISMTLKIK